MGRLKWASIVFACAAVSLAVGAGAFNSVSADRGVEVSVVEDEEAMLGIETAADMSFDNGVERRDIATITNRFGESVTVEVTVVDSGGNVPRLKSGGYRSVTLQPGDEATIEPRIQCSAKGGQSNPQSESWTLTVLATGVTVSVETTTEIQIECTGNGNGSSDGNGSTGTPPGQSKHE
ncbi:hypothetical protein [Halorientalis regularis]|uniref:Uncharacterized protein n=1 Tax=Halorientalis regularis TaxID=660518 RepID=A0A1G7SDP7_9EURY|nr:hypothetical protein [Halorientalis regularis]SDG21103.1 hypothetical protein SAMN05216218_11826 [Halorientalis regularis]